MIFLLKVTRLHKTFIIYSGICISLCSLYTKQIYAKEIFENTKDPSEA
jgi:hypothetical protein